MILSTAEVAARWGVDPARVRQLVAEGRIVPLNPRKPEHKQSTGYLFWMSEVERVEAIRRNSAYTKPLPAQSGAAAG